MEVIVQSWALLLYTLVLNQSKPSYGQQDTIQSGHAIKTKGESGPKLAVLIRKSRYHHLALDTQMETNSKAAKLTQLAIGNENTA